MPIYEFSCKKCKEPFDKLCSMNVDDSQVECPHCGSKGGLRRLSAFYSASKSGASVPEGCAMPAGARGGGCGSGHCGHAH